MSVCPKCKSEYREGFEYCSDCNVKLVDKKDIKEDICVMNKSSEIKIEYLMSVLNESEAKIIEDILKNNSIPVLKKHRGSGEYLQLHSGISNLGIDIYVPFNLKEIAENIVIENINMQQYYKENIDKKCEESYNEDEEIFNEMVEMHNRKRRQKVWIILIASIVPAMLVIVMSLLK